MHPLQHINLEHDAQMYITWTWTVYICEHMWYWHCDILPNYWIDKWSLHAYYASICIVYSARIQSGVHPKNLSRRLRIRAMEYSSNLLEQQHNIVQQSFFFKLESLNEGKFKVAHFFLLISTKCHHQSARGEEYEGSQQEGSGNEDEDGRFFSISKILKTANNDENYPARN